MMGLIAGVDMYAEICPSYLYTSASSGSEVDLPRPTFGFHWTFASMSLLEASPSPWF
jgi:hypothetical protein